MNGLERIVGALNDAQVEGELWLEVRPRRGCSGVTAVEVVSWPARAANDANRAAGGRRKRRTTRS